MVYFFISSIVFMHSCLSMPKFRLLSCVLTFTQTLPRTDTYRHLLNSQHYIESEEMEHAIFLICREAYILILKILMGGRLSAGIIVERRKCGL